MINNDTVTDDGVACVTVFGCDRWPLHFACRTGNYQQVKYMIDTLGFDYDKINEADDHNATPLYHAALIGSTDICRFLLQRGAICTENDSARVFYVALTPALRTILREWSLSAASVDPYLQSLQQNFTMNNSRSNNRAAVCVDEADASGTSGHNDSTSVAFGSTDCMIQIWNGYEGDDRRQTTMLYRTVTVHRIILKYRCPRMFDKVQGRDNKNGNIHYIDVNCYDTLHCDVLVRVIEYLYTGKIELMNLEIAFLSMQIAKEWDLHEELCFKIQSAIDQFLTQIEQQKLSSTTCGYDDHLTGSSMVKNYKTKSSWSRTTNPVILASLGVTDGNITTTLVDDNKEPIVEFRKCTISDTNQLRSDMKRLAQFVSTPRRLATGKVPHQKDNDASLPSLMCSDLLICCHMQTYHVHRFRLIQHSEYFLCALKGNFMESVTSTVELSSMIPVHATEVLPLIIQWMYTDGFLHPEGVSIATALELIQVCTALLCSPRLFSYVVNTIIVPNLSIETVFDMLEFTHIYPGSVDRLESKCCEVIAQQLEGILTNDVMSAELRYIVVTEIADVRQGGNVNESDIPLIAEIRRAINRLVNMSNKERVNKLQLLKAFVEEVHYDIKQEQLSC